MMPRNISHDSEKWRLLTPLIKDTDDKQKHRIFVKNSHFKQIQKYIFKKTENLPRYVKRRLIRHYVKIFNQKLKQGVNNELFANIWLREVVKPVESIIKNLPFEAGVLRSDEKVKAIAQACADDCLEIVTQIGGVFEKYEENLDFAFQELVAYCKEKTVVAPYSERIKRTKEIIADNENKPVKKMLSVEEIEQLQALIVALQERGILRMNCEKWWYRKLKRIKDQANEHILICIGEVQKKISPYISSQSLQEWKSQQKANRKYLESMELVQTCQNEQGEEWEFIPTITFTDTNGNELSRTKTLADFFDESSSNPRNRFTELMVRCKGLENLAEDDGHIGLFITITAPSQYHAISKGKSNPKFNGSTPKQTQAFLVNQWAKTRSSLAREGIEFYGVRVVEPHHDATPHWHMLLFIEPEDKEQLLRICRYYAFEVDPNENGAQKHRFTVEEIDPKKGSATGYIAKYLSKNINGEYIEGGTKDHQRAYDHDIEDYDSGKTAKEGAKRATAWASRWSIRQFQFFGAEPVTIYREARRLKEGVADKEIEAIRQAVESKDSKGKWYQFTKAMREHRVELAKEWQENNYNELIPKIKGLISSKSKIITRDSTFALRKCGSVSPWSPVNNCTASNYEASRLDRLGFSAEEKRLLSMGCRVSSGDGFIYQVKDNQLREYRV